MAVREATILFGNALDASGILRLEPHARPLSIARSVDSLADSLDDALSLADTGSMPSSMFSTPGHETVPLIFPSAPSAPPATRVASPATRTAPSTTRTAPPATRAAPPVMPATPTVRTTPLAARTTPLAARTTPLPTAATVAPPASAPITTPVTAAAPAARGYTPYIAQESHATTWYVVTRGRRVGVFDSWYVNHPLFVTLTLITATIAR